jgi:hypothetical protein
MPQQTATLLLFGPILLRLTFLFLLLCTRLILTHWLSTASVLLLGVMVALTLMTLMKWRSC